MAFFPLLELVAPNIGRQRLSTNVLICDMDPKCQAATWGEHYANRKPDVMGDFIG
jgi:hypothetical protein